MIHLCNLTYTFVGHPRFAWEPSTWGPIPHWLLPQSITAIESPSRSHLQLAADQNPSLPQYIFRVTSPVVPFYKTSSEVATISNLREHTPIPAPHVIAHSSTAEKEPGCEWTLMERVPGVALAAVLNDIDMEAESGRQSSLLVLLISPEISDNTSLVLETTCFEGRWVLSRRCGVYRHADHFGAGGNENRRALVHTATSRNRVLGEIGWIAAG
jgi:hypothetical protein